MLTSRIQSLQDLSETRVSKLNTIWSLAATIETQTMTRSTDLLNHLAAEIPRNNPVLDSMMFLRHNATQWSDPPDFSFEPSPVWLDDDTMAADEAAKTFLRNILMKSKPQLAELRRECEGKRREVEGAKRVRQAIREGKDKRDEVEVVRAQFNIQESLHESERKMVTAEVEVATITQAVGDVSVGAKNHAFKSQTFKIPTNCDLCGERIWGLSAKGFDCRDCGFTCHNKCEMKVPADCPGETDKEGRKKLKAERQAAASANANSSQAQGSPNGGMDDMPRISRSDTMGSMNTLSSGYAASAQRSVSGATVKSPDENRSAAPKAHRVVAPPPDTYLGNGLNGGSRDERARMMYSYQANGEGEITVAEGSEISIVEQDGELSSPLPRTFPISPIIRPLSPSRRMTRPDALTDNPHRRQRLAPRNRALDPPNRSRASLLHRAPPPP